MAFQCTPFFDGSDSWHLNGIERRVDLLKLKICRVGGILDKKRAIGSQKEAFFSIMDIQIFNLAREEGPCKTHSTMPFIQTCGSTEQLSPNFFFDFI